MFQFPRFPSSSLCVQQEDTGGSLIAGFPIRKSPDQRLFTAPRGLSQCPTSFIGTWRQGIHRKPLVASPRDAEKLILFGLQIYLSILFRIILLLISYYSVGKVLASPLTGERCAQLLFRASLTLQPLFSFQTKRPGSPPGRNSFLCDRSLLMLCQTNDLNQIFISLQFNRNSSGDDGIRTRGLRLAKALLSR